MGGHHFANDYSADWNAIAAAVKAHHGNRCERCGHPNEKPWKGRHFPIRALPLDHESMQLPEAERADLGYCGQCRTVYDITIVDVDAPCYYGEPAPCDDRCTHRTNDKKQRVLTVDHLDGDKANNDGWNLAALCQSCHLSVQGRVRMEQTYAFRHTEWMRPHVEGMLEAQAAGTWPRKETPL